MEQQSRVLNESLDWQADRARAPEEGGDYEDEFGGPDRDIYPRDRFRAALRGEMTPEEYIADLHRFIKDRAELDRRRLAR
jgi:hypothetical protein